MENETSAFFGEARVGETIRMASNRTAQGVLDAVLTATSDFAGTAPQADDLTMLTVRRPAAMLASAARVPGQGGTGDEDQKGGTDGGVQASHLTDSG
jgi:hypothetical protein